MSTIGRLNCRVTVQRWNQTIDDAGGNVAVLSDSWVKWARVEDRSGSVQLSNEQRSWSYDYKLTLRYEISRKTNSNDTILYKTKKLQINSLSIENEGNERFEVLRCSLIEDLADFIPPSDCTGMENFTSVTKSDVVNGLITFTFSGGNLLGTLQAQLTGFPLTDYPAGIDEIQFGALNLGNYTLRWRKKCGENYTTYNEYNFSITNEGYLSGRLTLNNGFENNVQFPVKVAYVVTNVNQQDQLTNSNQIANDENEFMSIWNVVNAHIGVLDTAEYKVFPTISYWQFTGVLNNNVHRPTAMWCFPI